MCARNFAQIVIKALSWLTRQNENCPFFAERQLRYNLTYRFVAVEELPGAPNQCHKHSDAGYCLPHPKPLLWHLSIKDVAGQLAAKFNARVWREAIGAIGERDSY
jgi:hypothetical protein